LESPNDINEDERLSTMHLWQTRPIV